MYHNFLKQGFYNILIEIIIAGLLLQRICTTNHRQLLQSEGDHMTGMMVKPCLPT